MNSLMRWLAPPVFAGDEEKTHQAALINLIGLISIALILTITVGTVFGVGTPTLTLILDLFACLVLAQFLRWVHTGRVNLARIGFVVFGLGFIMVATASLGTVRTPTTSIFVFWVLMTGVMYGRRGILFGTAAASLAVLVLIVAERANWLPQPFLGVGLTQWATFTAVFGFTSGLTYYITLRTRRALALAVKEIEQRKRVESELKESEQRYRSLVEWTPQALFVYRDDVVLYVNPAAVKLSGAGSARDMLGTSLLDWVHPETRRLLLARRANPKKLEHDIHAAPLEEKLRRVDGTVVDVEIRIRTIDYDGKPARQAALRDITERMAAVAALEAARAKAENASRAKSRFLASASHDLRQPAHALGLFVAGLAALPNDEPTRRLVDRMDAAVRAMQDMLDGFFDISRLDSEQTQVIKVGFPIQSVFEQLHNGFGSAASEKGLRLRFRPSAAWVESDRSLLYRILLNLISNAVRYTEHGSVLVACRPTRDGSQLRIEVRDSGVGIAAEHHEKIFQEFFQVNNFQRDRRMGLGVGLSIVERACRLLDHRLAMQSAPGCGTRFTLTLPMAFAQPGGRPLENTELVRGREFDGLRVLLVEDDVLGRVGMADLLESWGCTVLAAEGAQAGCDLLRPDQPLDIIISDFRLGGGINGIEAVAMLRAAAGRRIAACLVSGDTDADLGQQAEAAGLTLLKKPVRPANLRSLMRQLAKT